MAPERSISTLATNNADHSAAGDVWSAGVIHYTMVARDFFHRTLFPRDYFIQFPQSMTQHLVEVVKVIGAPPPETVLPVNLRPVINRARTIVQDPTFLKMLLDLLLQSGDPENLREAKLLESTLKFVAQDRSPPAVALARYFPGEAIAVPHMPSFRSPSCDITNTTAIAVAEARHIFWQLSLGLKP
eukprot:PhF_6_TR39861/c0_g2_i1/m.59261